MVSNSATHAATQQSIKAYVDSSILTKDNTDEITEGSTNLYFTNARVITALSGASTNNISENTNLYFTNARADARIANALLDEDNMASDSATKVPSQQSVKAFVEAQIATKDNTDEMTEGSSNLYFTNARADARITNALKDEDDLSSDSATHVPSQQSVKAYVDAQVAGKDNSDEIAEGSTNLYFTNARADARVQAAIDTDVAFGSASDTLVPSQLAVKTYVDAQVDTADALSELSGDSDDITEGSTNIFFTNARADARIAAASTSDLSEGTNQYFTTARADARVSAVVDTAFVNGLNVNATTLDSIDSASFLRSDANDTHSGTITPNADNTLDLGSGSLRYNQVFAVSFEGTATSAKYADLAEKYTTDEEIEAGTVVCFGGEAEITSCKAECDHRVAGVISTDPAYMMNSDGEGQYLALTGRVPTKVTGPVAKGDLMVSSSVEGHAMVDNNAQPGRIIGKAVGSSEGGEAVIEVLVNMM
jgi:hypothetical protein